MTDLDQLLDRASRDVRASVRQARDLEPEILRRRSTTRRTVTTFTAIVVVLGVIGFGSIVMNRAGEVAEPDGLITSEEILHDGVVTEDEYRSGALARVECLSQAGFDATVSFDERTQHAVFRVDHTNDERAPSAEADAACMEKHFSHNVGLGWAATLGQLDLDELARQETETFSCVEAATGQDFGDISHDQYGFLTETGLSAKDAAFEYQDHEPWMRCQNDLGFLEESKNETRAIFECVERRTGEDYGEIEFDEFGVTTEDSRTALRSAVAVDDHAVWWACEEELGVVFSHVAVSDN